MSGPAPISVDAALELVLSKTRALRSTLKARDEAAGYVLAEDVTSDIDSPPHDKSTVDGYAIRSADLPAGQGSLTVLEEVVAGALPTRPLTPGTATARRCQKQPTRS
jgi:molybdopterin molybdotransferase